MMDVGTRVQVQDGEHHGKTGEIVSVTLRHNYETGGIHIYPVVRLKDGTEVEIPGNYLTTTR